MLMKNFIQLLLGVVLIGCLAACAASPSKTTALVPEPSSSVIVGFATLASFGTFEMELAPLYTRLAVLRHNAARDLRSGDIDVELAKKVQLYADVLRSQLDNARQFDATKHPEQAHKIVLNATHALDSIEGMLP